VTACCLLSALHAIPACSRLLLVLLYCCLDSLIFPSATPSPVAVSLCILSRVCAIEAHWALVCWMNRAFYARLRHHSLTCSSQPVPISSQTFASTAHSLVYSIRDSRFTFAPLAAFGLTRSLKSFSTTSTASFHNSIMNGSNGTPRAKRKSHPGMADERPQKQHRAINGKESAGDNTPEVGSLFEEELEMEEPRIMAAMADTAEWQATIEKVVRNVVSIRFCQTCSFDTDPALTSEATGFVVDAERG